MNKKSRHFDIRLSEKDKKKLETDAKRAGLTESAYIRALINNKSPKTREDYQQIQNLISEINAIGNNINQIVKKYNSNFFNEHDRNRLFSLMNTLIKNTEEIINGKNINSYEK